MRKAHINNFIIILIAYVIPFVINEFVNIDSIRYEMNNIYEWIIYFVLFTLLAISVFFLAKNVFNIFIKHDKKYKLTKPRLIVFITSILTTFTFIYFNIEYYYYFGSMILLYSLYFAFLYVLDNKYIKKSKDNKINISDHLVNDFLNLLGGKDNIINVSYEYSRLKVEVKNIKSVNLEKIKELGAQGLFIAGNKIQAIVGNNANDLENAIKRYITNV